MGAELDENTKRLAALFLCSCCTSVMAVVLTRAFRCSLIGQLLVVSFDGPIVTPEVRTLIEKYYVGSFLLGRRNIRGECRFYPIVLHARYCSHEHIVLTKNLCCCKTND